MTADPYAGIPLRPPSVAEWEDLLVRVEIAARALRATLEDVPPGDPEARGLLAEAAAREAERQREMEALRTSGPVAPAAPAAAPEGDTAALAERFASLRMRTFAMAQRRGVDLWEWEAAGADGARLSVYRLFTRMTRDDAALLAALRGRARAAGGAAC